MATSSIQFTFVHRIPVVQSVLYALPRPPEPVRHAEEDLSAMTLPSPAATAPVCCEDERVTFPPRTAF
jgi:hypothetical protein